MESTSKEEDSDGRKMNKHNFRKRKMIISISGDSSETPQKKRKTNKQKKVVQGDSSETPQKKRKTNKQKKVVQGKISNYFNKNRSKIIGHKSSGSKFKDLIFSTISKRRKKNSDLTSLSRRLFNSENFPETKKLIDEVDLGNLFGGQAEICGFSRDEVVDQNVHDSKYLDYFAIEMKVKKVDDNLQKKKHHFSDEWLSIRTRASPKVLHNLMNHLSQAQMKDIIDIGFGSLISMATEEIPAKISHYVVDHLDTDSMKLKISTGVISITPDLVYKVLKVPLGGDDIESLNRLERDDLTTIQWQNQFKGGSITPKKVYDKIKESGIGGILFKLNFLVLFATTMGVAGKNGQCRPEKSIVGYINEHTKIEKLNWCKYVWSCLKESKKGWIRDDNNSFYSGPLTAITLMYIISTKCDSVSVPQDYPSIQYWTTDLIKQRENFELSNGGFGLLELNSVDSSDDNLLEREIEAKMDKLDQKVNLLELVLEDLQIQFSSVYSDHPDNNRLKITKQKFNEVIRNTDLSDYGFENNSLDNEIVNLDNVREEDYEKNCLDNHYGINNMLGTYVGEFRNSFQAEEEIGKEIYVGDCSNSFQAEEETGKRTYVGKYSNSFQAEEETGKQIYVGECSNSFQAEEETGKQIYVGECNNSFQTEEEIGKEIYVGECSNSFQAEEETGKQTYVGECSNSFQAEEETGKQIYVGECSNSFQAEEENGNDFEEEMTTEINQKIIAADIVLQNQNNQKGSLIVSEVVSVVKNLSESEFEGKILMKGTAEDDIINKDAQQEVVSAVQKSSQFELQEERMIKEVTTEKEIENEQPERQHSSQMSVKDKSNVNKPNIRRLFNQFQSSFDDMPKHPIDVPPSFSLGFDFDDSQSPLPVENNKSSDKGKKVTFASEPEINVYNKNMKPETSDSNVRVQPQREINIPWFLKSPFKERGSKMSRKVNKLSVDESVTADTLFIIDEDAYPYDVVYSSKKTGYSILRASLESLTPGQFVSKNVIDTWADLLNFEEIYKSASSPSRYFFQSKLTNHLTIEDIVLNRDTLTLFEKYINQSDYNKKRMMLPYKTFDLVFFPVTTLDHFFLICFHMKNGRVVIIDNSKIDEELTTQQRYLKLPQELIRVFDQYLINMNPGSTASIFRHSEPERLKMEWRTENNSIDNAVFVMSHMDNYFGESESTFHFGFCNESKDQDQQLNFLRFKYAARILLSDNNNCKVSFQKNVDKFRTLNKDIRKELIKNSGVRTAESLDKCLYGT